MRRSHTIAAVSLAVLLATAGCTSSSGSAATSTAGVGSTLGSAGPASIDAATSNAVVSGSTVASATGTGPAASTEKGSPTKTSGAAHTVTPATPVSLPAASAILNVVAKRKDVELSSCTPGTSGWVAKGKVTNSAGEDTDYAITVFFTTPEATVLGSAQTKVSVKAHSSLAWQATGKFTGANAMTCVLRGVG